MHIIPLVLIVVVLAIVFVLVKKIVITGEVKMTDIPAIFDKLRVGGKDGSFAVFIFTPLGKASPGEAINLQFSIEQGQIGLDWVLLGPLNLRDKEKFLQFAGKLGHKVVAREGNKVKYLRVEEGDLPKLCEASIRDLYAISSDTGLGFIPEGFTWP